MSDDTDLIALIPRLRYNGAANLRHAHEHPGKLNPDSINGDERIFTGLGKWTTLAAIGVENHLVSLGLAEKVTRGTTNTARRDNWRTIVTPLGRRMGRYLSEHWKDITPQLKDMR